MSFQVPETGRWAELRDAVESERKHVSAHMAPRIKAEFGQFLTPIDVARFMAGMFRYDRNELRILDPGAGTGCLTAAFIAAAACTSCPVKAINATLFEVDP